MNLANPSFTLARASEINLDGNSIRTVASSVLSTFNTTLNFTLTLLSDTDDQFCVGGQPCTCCEFYDIGNWLRNQRPDFSSFDVQCGETSYNAMTIHSLELGKPCEISQIEVGPLAEAEDRRPGIGKQTLATAILCVPILYIQFETSFSTSDVHQDSGTMVNWMESDSESSDNTVTIVASSVAVTLIAVIVVIAGMVHVYLKRHRAVKGNMQRRHSDPQTEAATTEFQAALSPYAALLKVDPATLKISKFDVIDVPRLRICSNLKVNIQI